MGDTRVALTATEVVGYVLGGAAAGSLVGCALALAIACMLALRTAHKPSGSLLRLPPSMLYRDSTAL